MCQQDSDWDQTFQFLPAADNKRLEKKRGAKRTMWIGLGLVLAAAAMALVTGLLVWHFHSERISTRVICTF